MVITNADPEPMVADPLLARARAGDAEAFCLLIEPLQTRLLRQAIALSRHPDSAEDLVSETLIEAWKSLPRYNATCRLSTWLYSILLHRYYKAMRHARSRPISLNWLPFFQAEAIDTQQLNLASSDPRPDETIERNESTLLLHSYIGALPKKHREIILLRFFEEASLPDMAVVLGCSVGTIKSRLHHALEKLRKMKMNLSEIKRDTQI